MIGHPVVQVLVCGVRLEHMDSIASVLQTVKIVSVVIFASITHTTGLLVSSTILTQGEVSLLNLHFIMIKHFF